MHCGQRKLSLAWFYAGITQILKNFQHVTGKWHLWPHLLNTNLGWRRKGQPSLSGGRNATLERPLGLRHGRTWRTGSQQMVVPLGLSSMAGEASSNPTTVVSLVAFRDFSGFQKTSILTGVYRWEPGVRMPQSIRSLSSRLWLWVRI